MLIAKKTVRMLLSLNLRGRGLIETLQQSALCLMFGAMGPSAIFAAVPDLPTVGAPDGLVALFLASRADPAKRVVFGIAIRDGRMRVDPIGELDAQKAGTFAAESSVGVRRVRTRSIADFCLALALQACDFFVGKLNLAHFDVLRPDHRRWMV